MFDLTAVQRKPIHQVILFIAGVLILFLCFHFASSVSMIVSNLHHHGQELVFDGANGSTSGGGSAGFNFLHFATPAPTITPTPTATPLPGTKRTSSIDGMESVFIPAGSFAMGVSGDATSGPSHKVTVSAFWINRTQVTNAMYALCVQAGVCQPPIRKAINPHYYDPKYADHPAVYIAWSLAEAYCEWTGGKLPTEAQWERAATNDGRRDFAWGNSLPRPDLSTVNNFFHTTTKVGSHPKGASPFGVLDMGSDVREWVWDWYDPYYYNHSPSVNPTGPAHGKEKALRGASWEDDLSDAHATRRYGHDPDSAGDNRGFRCAYP